MCCTINHILSSKHALQRKVLRHYSGSKKKDQDQLEQASTRDGRSGYDLEDGLEAVSYS